MARTVAPRGTGRQDYSQLAFTEIRPKTPDPIARITVGTALVTVTFDPAVTSLSIKNVGDTDCFVERNRDATTAQGILEKKDALIMADEAITKITALTASGTTQLDIYPSK